MELSASGSLINFVSYRAHAVQRASGNLGSSLWGFMGLGVYGIGGLGFRKGQLLKRLLGFARALQRLSIQAFIVDFCADLQGVP